MSTLMIVTSFSRSEPINFVVWATNRKVAADRAATSDFAEALCSHAWAKTAMACWTKLVRASLWRHFAGRSV